MRGRLLVAVALSAAVVLSAPYVGELRGLVRSALPQQYVRIVAGVVGGCMLAALAAGVAVIRERRARRYALIALALVVGVAYARYTRTGNPEIDAVERFHFVEYGVVALLFYRVWQRRGDAAALALTLAAGTTVAVADEWFQWFIPSRAGELRDVLLDMVAVSCGLLFALGVWPSVRLAWPAGRRPRVVLALAATAATLVLALFVQIVHLGHEVEDDEIGSFRSRYSRSTLERLMAARRAAWTARPPVAMPLLSREDQYLAEARWHVQERNDGIASGDMTMAWNENRILEKFYAPVLDLAMRDSRWSPERREMTEAAPRRRSPAYISNAEPYPIYTWPRRLFWLAVAIAIGAIWLPLRAR